MFIDGPYGTPIQGLTTVDHAILIAAGIGVTPFASVLQHILNEKRNTTQTKEKSDFRLKKVKKSILKENIHVKLHFTGCFLKRLHGCDNFMG